jgi:hypothetical protein
MQTYPPPSETHWVFLGLEIEIAWSSFFPGVYQEWFIQGGITRSYADFDPGEKKEFDSVCTELDREMIPRFESIAWELWLSRGWDAYWEWVFPPMRDPKSILHCVQTIHLRGGLPPAYRAPHSLQITIGGAAEHPLLGIYIVLLEIISGVNQARIMSAVHSVDPNYPAGWARKGTAGYKIRPANELLFGATTGVEIRTLILPNDPKIQELLISVASSFGELLLLASYKKSPLYKKWQPVIDAIIQKLELYGLSQTRDWGNPVSHGNLWIQYGQFLQKESSVILDFLHKSLV